MPIINGTEIAKEILERLKKQPKPKKFLAAVLVGNDPASASFIRQKEKVGKELGIDFRLHTLSDSLSQDKLRAEVLKIASHKTCGGMIVQLPLPEKIDRHYVLNVVPREKDVDVLGERALGAFYTKRNPVHPPAVAVIEEIIARLNLNIRTMKVAVIGTGLLVGKPAAVYFTQDAATLAVFHRASGDVRTQLKGFDLIVSGVGQSRLFSAKDLDSKAVVIDFGYDERNGKMAGDFDPGEAGDLGVRYTPTPGGTGPVLVAKLYENFYTLQNHK